MATEILFANNAVTKLNTDLTETDTILTVVEGTGILFAQAASGVSHFYITIVDLEGNMEILKVTNREEDTFSVERGQEATTARAFPAESIVHNRVTTQGLYDLKNEAVDIANNAQALAEEANTNAAKAVTEVENLATLPRTITLTGDVVGGPVSFNNRGNIVVSTVVAGTNDATTKFNRQVKTTSGEMLAPHSAIYRFNMCGGGGAGGGTGLKGGFAGGATTVTVASTSFTATGGSGGGGSGSSNNTISGTCYGGAGGGGAGKIGSTQLFIPVGTKIVWSIGAGGSASSGVTTPTGSEAGFNANTSSNFMAGTGAAGAGTGCPGDGNSNVGGNGGSGGINGLGFGGGGGGAGGNGNSAANIGRGGRGGEGGQNGQDGSTSVTSSRAGGNGGNGVVIIEWTSRG